MDHWGHHLQENSFTSEHQQRLKHINTDVPSRRHYPAACPHCQKVKPQLDSMKVCCHYRLLGSYCAEEWTSWNSCMTPMSMLINVWRWPLTRRGPVNNCLANSLYCLTKTKGKLPKLQPSWKDFYKVITWINDVVC
jgi:hypothetical protein